MGKTEIWLPRDRRVELTIQGMCRKVTAWIESLDKSNTKVHFEF
jgi:hypothetical protein